MVCTCDMTEQTTTREAAICGLTACDQIPMAVMPVPNPTNPDTKPPHRAPTTMIRICSKCTSCKLRVDFRD